eukprot:369516-Prorocentrum_minimum.AAC.1
MKFKWAPPVPITARGSGGDYTVQHKLVHLGHVAGHLLQVRLAAEVAQYEYVVGALKNALNDALKSS